MKNLMLCRNTAKRVSPSRRRGAQQGFSLVETMVAGAVFLTVAIGILPLFTLSLTNNNAGREAMQAANHSRTQLEELYQVPFHHPDLTLAEDGDVVTHTAWWNQGDPALLADGNEGWQSAPTGEGLTTWSRRLEVRQYGIADLDDDSQLNTPLNGDTDPVFVHLKELQVELNTTRSEGTALGVGRHVIVRVLKPF